MEDIGDLRSPAGQIPAGRLRFQDVDLVVGHLSGGDGLLFPHLADRMPVVLVPDCLEFRIDNVVRHTRTPRSPDRGTRNRHDCVLRGLG